MKHQVINLAKELKVKPRRLVSHLAVPVGKSVQAGQVLAQKKILGLFTKSVRAPEAGVIDKIEATSGRLFLNPVNPAGDFDSGWGEAKAVLVKTEEELNLKNLDSDWQGKIVWAPGISEAGVIFKAEVVGIKGLILPLAARTQLKDNWRNLLAASDLAVVFLKSSAINNLAGLVGKSVSINGQKGSVSEA